MGQQRTNLPPINIPMMLSVTAPRPWKKFNTAAPAYLNDLMAVDERMGLWIRATEAATLTVAGTLPLSPSIALKAGWNLVGYPSSTTRALPDVLSSVPFSLVYAYDAFTAGNPWQKFDPNVPPYVNSLNAMTPARGYWIAVGDNAVWTVLK